MLFLFFFFNTQDVLEKAVKMGSLANFITGFTIHISVSGDFTSYFSWFYVNIFLLTIYATEEKDVH